MCEREERQSIFILLYDLSLSLSVWVFSPRENKVGRKFERTGRRQKGEGGATLQHVASIIAKKIYARKAGRCRKEHSGANGGKEGRDAGAEARLSVRWSRDNLGGDFADRPHNLLLIHLHPNNSLKALLSLLIYDTMHQSYLLRILYCLITIDD